MLVQRTGVLVGVMFALIMLNAFVYRALFVPHVLTVSVLRVPKGDAVLVRGPRGETVLIDAGPDAGVLRMLGAALPFWQRRIEAFVLTSSAAGSTGGAPDVFSRYRISYFIRPAAQGAKTREAALREAAGAEAGLRTITATRGMHFAFRDGAAIDVLWPENAVPDAKIADAPLVLRIRYGHTAFLIQENLSARIQKWLASADASIPSDIVISSSTPPQTFVSDGNVIR